MFNTLHAIGATIVVAITCALPATTLSAAPLGATNQVMPLEAVELVTLPRLDFQAIDAQDHQRAAEGAPYRYAIPHDMALSPAFDGTWERIGDHGLLWRLRVASLDATSINLAFETFRLPDTAILSIYTADGSTAIRPFTSDDNNVADQLWTPPLPGDDIVIELQIDAQDRDFIERNLELTGINVGYRGFYDAAVPPRSGSCNYDVWCSEADEWRDEIPCVAAISTGGSLFCSGFMVNNLTHDGTPFFMTANHCGVSSGNASSLVCFWNYQDGPEAPLDCPGNSSETGTLDQFSTGSTYRAGGSSSDFTLVELNTAPNEAWEVGYCGWDANDVATEWSVAIHQPNVDAKRWSIDYEPSQIYGYNQPGTTHLRIVDWDLGTTEPGSSGSPLYNQNHHVVGQLHGGYAACGNDLEDWYGRFAVSYPAGLSTWLDPDGTGSLVCDTLGKGLSIDPATDVLHYGEIGGPFNDASINYTMTNNTPDLVSYTVSQGGTFDIELDGSLADLNGVLPGGGGEVVLTASLAANTASLPAGTYENILVFSDNTNGQAREIVHTLEVGLSNFTTDPEHGLVAGGPEGGPFPTTQDYLLTSQRPTDAVIEVTSDANWISINGGKSDTVTLTYEGDSETVSIGFSDAANSLPPGLVEGTVTFNNINGDGGDTTRTIVLDVGRFTYVAYDTPIDITDNNTIQSFIEVTDVYCMADVDVELDVSHTFIGDLIIDVTSPEGTTVRLHDRSGSSEDDIVTTYDDDGEGTPPDGPGALSDFDGEIVVGTWTMTISDNAGIDQGSLNAWGLKIASTGEYCPAVAYGQAVYTDENTDIDITLEGASPEGGTMEFIITTLPSNGDLSLPSGSPINSTPYALPGGGNMVTYSPDSSYIGPDDFSFMVDDGFGESEDAWVSIQVGAVPNPDNCAEAAPIANGLWEFSTLDATTDGAAHGECQFDGQTYHDIWYRYLACDDGQLVVSTCEDLGGGADFDTDLVVYEGDDCSSLVLMGCNDDDPDNACGGSSGGYHSTVTINVIRDQMYTLRVGGWNDGNLGTGVLLVDGPETGCDEPCEGDADGNGSVGVDDLLIVIGAWGSSDELADLDGDGTVGVNDLLIVIANWGECP